MLLSVGKYILKCFKVAIRLCCWYAANVSAKVQCAG